MLPPRAIAVSTLIAAMAAGCEAPQTPVTIGFEAQLGGRPIACGAPVEGTSMTDLRLYIHDLRLVRGDGSEQDLALVGDPIWQNEKVAMLDFEDGSGRCQNGSELTNTVLKARVSKGDYRGLRFRVGVPELLNHESPLVAEAPLNDSVMHWHWRSGYKFMRAGLATNDDGFWMHLGSARCSGTIGNIEGCDAANRPEVQLDDFVPGEHVVIIDLATLTAGIDLGDQEATNCSSGPAEDECRQPFAELGIDFDSGTNIATAKVFRLGTPP